MRPILLIVILIIAETLSIQTANSAECLLKPKRLNIQVSDDGLNWLAGEEFSGSCNKVPANEWNIHQLNTTKVWEATNGPSGSGRYWNITIGLSNNLASHPVKGFCLYTSTIGWRTLQRYDRTPLPWINDLDEDGKPEFLLWDSFPLSDELSTGQFGLVAWVYKLTEKNNFKLDWDLTKKMASELAEAYRQPIEDQIFGLSNLRKKAAEGLNALASGKCINRTETARIYLPAGG